MFMPITWVSFEGPFSAGRGKIERAVSGPIMMLRGTAAVRAIWSRTAVARLVHARMTAWRGIRAVLRCALSRHADVQPKEGRCRDRYASSDWWQLEQLLSRSLDVAAVVTRRIRSLCAAQP